IGALPVHLTLDGKESPFFRGFPATFPAAQWHSDTFDLPQEARLLATSQKCKHQAFSWNRCLGIQFHPEVTLDRGRELPDEYADELPASGKTAAQVREELESTFNERARLCGLLVENFVRMASQWPT